MVWGVGLLINAVALVLYGSVTGELVALGPPMRADLYGPVLKLLGLTAVLLVTLPFGWPLLLRISSPTRAHQWANGLYLGGVILPVAGLMLYAFTVIGFASLNLIDVWALVAVGLILLGASLGLGLR